LTGADITQGQSTAFLLTKSAPRFANFQKAYAMQVNGRITVPGSAGLVSTLIKRATRKRAREAPAPRRHCSKQWRKMNDCGRKLSFLRLKSSVAIILAIVATVSGCAGSAHPRESRSTWLKGVSQSDRAKLRALREMVKDDPAVRATDEKRKRANDEYHEALRAAILKQDPSVAPILDRIRKRREKSVKAKSD
jgi:hypothetical protein